MGLATHTPQQQSTSTEAEALREPLDVDWTWTNLISQVRCASAETETRDCVFIFIAEAEGGAACIYPIFSPLTDGLMDWRPTCVAKEAEEPQTTTMCGQYLC